MRSRNVSYLILPLMLLFLAAESGAVRGTQPTEPAKAVEADDSRFFVKDSVGRLWVAQQRVQTVFLPLIMKAQ